MPPGHRDPAQLYQGVQLAAAREATRVWAADPGRYPALTAAEAEFLRASGRAGTRGRWGRRTLAGALVLLLLATLAGAGLAVRSARSNASQQRTAALSERLAAQSTALEATDPVTASLLAGPHGGSRRPRRPVTACSSPSPSRCAASWPPRRAR